ncbi:hypothetical protein T02_12951 [Trichinella nativa]|uniref:Uncharacterized protein n=1 Tax=Trichinella nativa TaxID=6335 RepID=A0A0V1KIQ9_9BILA|nr:hypothetical protein T02_12951 [Trichinella nativa]
MALSAVSIASSIDLSLLGNTSGAILFSKRKFLQTTWQPCC